MQSIRDYPVLIEFLSNYWFETADLVYGKDGICGAARLFVTDWPSERAALFDDLLGLSASPYLRDRPAWTQKSYRNFWDSPGVARVLTNDDVEALLALASAP